MKTKNDIVIQELIVQPPRRSVIDVGEWRSALRMADRGNMRRLYDLYDDMMIDGVLSDAVSKRIEAVQGSNLVYMDQNQQEVDVLSDLIDTEDFEELIRIIMMSRIYGRAGAELNLIDGSLSVRELPSKHIDLKNREIIIDFMSGKSISYAGDDALIIMGKERDFGIVLSAMQYAIYKRGGFGDWAQWIELFGMPQRIGKYNTYDPQSKALLEKAFKEMGSAPYMVIPKESEIEIRETSQGSGTSFNEFRQACNEEILISILGQTLTTISGERGARSLGEVHKEVEESKNKSDMRYVQRVLNNKILPFLTNRGVITNNGRFVFPETAEDLSVQELVTLSSIISIPDSYIHDKYGIPMEESEEDSTSSDNKENLQHRDKKDNRLHDFFVNAPAEVGWGIKNVWQKLKRSTIIRLDDGYKIDLNKLLKEAINEVYNGTQEEVSKPLFDITNDALQHAVDKVMNDPSLDNPEDSFVSKYRYNSAVFSAFKSHQQVELLVDELYDQNGQLRSFREFKKRAYKILGKYNEQWLRTEYNTAVKAARSAWNYNEYLKSESLYPNLKYCLSTAKNKRESHLQYVGTVLPIRHPWWDTHMPPSEWNCACSVEPTDEPTTAVPTIELVNPVLSNNPGKTATPFRLDKHPYLRGLGTASCPECRRQGLVTKNKLGDNKEKLCPMHRLALETSERIQKERRKEKDKELKSWAKKNIPIGGKVLYRENFKSNKVIIYRSSIKNLVGHFVELDKKELAKDIFLICKKAQYIGKASIDENAANYKKKVAKGVTEYRYYKVFYKGFNLRLNMEVIDDYEIPYALNVIK